jgi:hypothetical protein
MRLCHSTYITLRRIAGPISGQRRNRLLLATRVSVQFHHMSRRLHVVHLNAVPRMITAAAREHLVVVSAEGFCGLTVAA